MALRSDSGMVTAELAAALPVLMIIVAVALSYVSVAERRVRAADAAREAARAAARGDPATGSRLAAAEAPGASVTIRRAGDQVIARVEITVHPLGGWLPGVTLAEHAVAASEPTTESGEPP